MPHCEKLQFFVELTLNNCEKLQFLVTFTLNTLNIFEKLQFLMEFTLNNCEKLQFLVEFTLNNCEKLQFLVTFKSKACFVLQHWGMVYIVVSCLPAELWVIRSYPARVLSVGFWVSYVKSILNVFVVYLSFSSRSKTGLPDGLFSNRKSKFG
jgi:hypothetical protein